MALSRAYSHQRCGGPCLGRRPDRTAEPALLRRVLRAPGSPSPSRRCGRRPHDRYRPVQGPQRQLRPCRRRPGPAGGRWRDHGGGPRRRRSGALRRGGVRRPAPQPEPRRGHRRRRAGPRRRGRPRPRRVRRAGCQRLGRRRRRERPGPADRRRWSPRRIEPSTGRSGRAATGWWRRRSGGARAATIPDVPRRDELLGADEDLEAVPLDDEEEGEAPDGRLTNGDLARIFHDIGDMLEVKGELGFKTVAYHRAADAIGRSAIDLVAAYRAGETPRVPGVGAAISDKILELATTGRMAYYDRLRAEIPPTLVEIMHIPGVGPKTVKQLHEQLGIESLEDLKRAAEAGNLRDLRGHVVPDRAARPGGDRPPRGEPQAPAAQPRRGIDRGHRRGPRGAPGRAVGRAGRVVPPQEGDDRRPRPARRDRRTGPRARHVHRSRRRGPHREPRPVQGCGPPAARAAGRPHGHAARRGRHVPHPFHGFEGAQRQAARPWPAIAAGACPRRAICASTRTASR